jgi:8-oxo-dGTP diphosphatase
MSYLTEYGLPMKKSTDNRCFGRVNTSSVLAFSSLFRTFYSMKEVAVGIIMKNGRVLACQRKRTAQYPLKWEFPGGKLEPGETARAALQRELREELALTASVDREFFRQEWTYAGETNNPQRDGSFRVFYFLVTHFSGEPENLAFEQMQWKLPHELLSMDILEGNREAVARLVKYAKEQQTA